MSDGTGSGTDVGKPVKYGRDRRREPVPIWQSKLYRRRRGEGVVPRIRRRRARRFDDAALLQEKRDLADRLFSLCDRADRAVRQRGGDISEDLARIAELSFIVSYWDSETAPDIGIWGPFEHLGESRDSLAAMTLASEVTGLASMSSSGSGSPSAGDPDA